LTRDLLVRIRTACGARQPLIRSSFRSSLKTGACAPGYPRKRPTGRVPEPNRSSDPTTEPRIALSRARARAPLPARSAGVRPRATRVRPARALTALGGEPVEVLADQRLGD